MIRCDDPDSFPASVLRDRHPAIVARVLADLPLPAPVADRLAAFLHSPIVTPLPRHAHDHADWDRWGAGHFGRSLFDVPFLWAENYFYRRLLQEIGYHDDGPWRGIDPFGPQKAADLPEPAVLAALDGLQDADLVTAAVWGNRADLGFNLVAAQTALEQRLIVDETERLWPHLTGCTVCVVADNAGRELLPDLVLIAHLLRTGRADKVELHVKPAPYFVSDALTADVLSELRRFPASSTIGAELLRALRTGTLELVTDAFYCAPLEFAEAPAGLNARFKAAKLTILKGDLNYRRLVSDRSWPSSTAFAQVTEYFPGPVAALRTVKSDVVVGLSPTDEVELPVSWRTSGAFAVVQVRD